MKKDIYERNLIEKKSAQQGFSSFIAGQFCETNIDECSSEPCQNNGTCEDAVDKYSCQCPRAYAGINCQHHICDVSMRFWEMVEKLSVEV